jgi:putative aldouronate transport system substrate-binding protein
MSHTTIDRRRLLQGSLGLGGLAALGLAGCSNEGRGGGTQADNNAVTLPSYIPYEGLTADLVGEDGVSDALLAYPADPQPVTDGPPGDGQDIAAFALTNNPAPPSLDRNEFWQELNDRLGFRLSVSLVPSGDFNERFQTSVAGDQLPDLFTFFPGGVPGLPGLLQERAVDLTDLLSGDAIAAYPFLASIPTDSWRSTVYGGKIYGIPIPRGALSSVVLYGRDDRLAERGIDPAEATTWEDFHALCTEVTSARAGEWAFGGGMGDLSAPMGTLRRMYGIANGWSLDGDTLVSSNEDERQLDALEAGRRIVADGLVHPDALSVNQQQRKTWTVNGTVMFIEDTYTGRPDLVTNYPIGDDFRLGVVPTPLADGGGLARMHLAGPTHNVTSIGLRAQDRTEAMLELFNYLAAPFGSAEHLFKSYGIEGVHHELRGTDPVLTEKGRSETQLSLRYLGEGPAVTYMPGNPDATEASFASQNETVPTAVANPTQGLFSETGSRRGGQIGEALGNVEADILEGREPVSAWTEAVARWKSNGGDGIRDELQAALAEVEGV